MIGRGVRQTILAGLAAVGVWLSIAPAFAQPAPVPALPDSERRTSYSITASQCNCAVNFAVFGDGTDFNNWVEVYLNDTRVNYNDATYGWAITSPSGSLSSLSRPISNAVLTFTNAQTGTVQIVGARRPRRVSQFSENAGVTARALNQALTDIVAQNRETWDKTNDMTGRGIFAPPGETLNILPPAATRAISTLGFDVNGQLTTFPGGNPTVASSITIQPPTSTLAQGLNITQSGPTTGSTAGPWSYNLVTVTDGGNLLTGNRDAFDLLGYDSSAFRVNDTVMGAEPTIRLGGTFAVNFTGTGGNAGGETVGVIGSSYSNASPGALWGAIGYASLGPSGNAAALIAVTAELSAQTGSTLAKRIGFLAISEAPVQGSAIDAAYVVASQNAGRGTPGGFLNVITISNNLWNVPALDPSANFFSADSATTITNWANMSNVTVTGEVLLFPNVNLPGAPSGFTLAPHVANAFQYGGQSTGTIAIEVDAFTGVPVFSGKRADTSSTSPSAVQSGETILGFSAQPYDGSTYGEIAGIGAHAAQNLSNTAHGSYMAFFTTPLNSITETEAGRFGPSGALLVGTTTDAAAGIVNVATGFRIGNAAATGHVLRGNGASYVDGQLSCSDLSTACITGISTLTFGTHLAAGGSSFNGTAGVTITSDATNANTASTIVARDGSGNFSAGTITAALTGHASLDLPLTGGTMSGAIAMGGNAITGGGAIGGTTLTASTSISSPIHAAPNAMLFESNGSTVGGFLNASQQWGFGANVAPATGDLLTLNQNSATPDAVSFGTNTLHMVGGNGNLAGVFADAYANQGFYAGRRADGTLTSKTAVSAGAVSFSFFGQEWDGAAYGSTGAIDFLSLNNASGTDHSGSVRVRTTPSGSTSLVTAAIFNASGGLSIGTATDPGANGLNVANYFASGTAGVTCSGTPTSSFASTKGIVTHC